MSAMTTQIISLTIAYSTVYSGADQRKHQSSAPLAYVIGIHRWPVNFQHKEPGTRKMFPFDDVIMTPELWGVYMPQPHAIKDYILFIWWLEYVDLTLKLPGHLAYTFNVEF